jgi:outer membrane protein
MKPMGMTGWTRCGSVVAVFFGSALHPLLGRADEAGPSVRSISIRECIERALANNLDIRIERINPGLAAWAVTREQGAFDPALTGRFSYEDVSEPLDPERAASLGLNSLETRRLRLRSGLSGKLPTGTAYELSGFDTRTEGTLAPDSVHVGTGSITLTQPLLKNFWLDPNTALLRVARKNRDIAVQNFVRQVIDTLSAAQNAYYELVFAIEDHKAKLEDLNRAKALLAENRKRVEIGVMSPLDVTQAEAGVAEREEAVIVAAHAIRDSENALKRLILPDVTEWRGVALAPVDYPLVQMVETDAARSIRTALETRPDFLAAWREIERRNILVKFNRNQLWPQIDLQGSYGLNARAGNFGNFVDRVAAADDPQWSVGVVVTVPLGNRQARADYQSAQLEEQKALLALKRLEQDIIVEVDNAARLVQTNLKRVDATRAASRLAEESLKAEEAKLRAGASTSFLVLQAQSQLAAARSAEIRARTDYDKSLVELARLEGTTLQQHQIELAEDF